ncbi:MAG: M48 family metallopeptidase, partial [Moraxellaceae bacterium]|nr:M48 family metallopeptidase [Moraxellaceae bacterium]
MNFFDHQDIARRKTGLLLAYFVLAVALTMVAVDAVFYLMLVMLGALHPGDTLFWHDWSPQALLGTLIAVMTGCLVEYLRLSGGGTALARSIGARRIDFATRDLQERQFINVVEEMSIASGVPVPALYVMDREAGINAFVAGLRPDDTVMVVTGGALAAFTRDELQAVAGHEYSHILNGDMRLNMRLMMILGGILVIGQLGSFLMRHARVSNVVRSRDNRGALMMIVAGLLIWLVGAIGLFFGRVIKAAISRQREFLADASSVQFTRNPSGLAHALIRIRNQAEGSVLDNLHAEDMSHLCFGEALHFSRWLATHPPLDERIRVLGEEYLVLARVRQREQDRGLAAAQRLAASSGAVLPAGVSGLAESSVSTTATAPASAETSGDLPPLEFQRPDPASAPTAAPMTTLLPSADAVRPAVQSAASSESLSASMVARVGTVNPAELQCARQMHERLPASVVKALETPRGTEALLFALTAKQSGLPALTVSTFMREQQSGLQADVMWIYQALGDLEMAHALPLVELALPRLQLLAPGEHRQLLGRLQAMA